MEKDFSLIYKIYCFLFLLIIYMIFSNDTFLTLIQWMDLEIFIFKIMEKV